MLSDMGKFLIISGVLLIVIGGSIWFFGKIGFPFGNFPGDIRIERERYSFYFPIVTCLVLSLLLTLLLNAFTWFLKK